MSDRNVGGGALVHQPDPPGAHIANDVTDIVITSAPIDGVTGAGLCAPASLARRTDVATVYINTGTKAVPVWKSVTHA